jgi:hypothetical protein
VSRILPRLVITLASSVCTLAIAALPPLDDAAKAKAAETAARNGWNDKVAAFALCKSQDAVAARYFSEMQPAGKPTAPPIATAECTDPGAYVAPTPPLETAGAHSPPATNKGPPSSNATATELDGGLKK